MLLLGGMLVLLSSTLYIIHTSWIRGAGGEVVVPPSPTIPHPSERVGELMYTCKGLGWHGLILVNESI